jgi:hypothetical protein
MAKEIEKKYLIREEEREYTTPAFFRLFRSVDDLCPVLESNP